MRDDWDAPDDGLSNSDEDSEEIRSSSSEDENQADGSDDHRGSALKSAARGGADGGVRDERRQGWYVKKLARAGFADVQPKSGFVHRDGNITQGAGGWVDYDYQLDPELELPNSVALSLDTSVVPGSAETIPGDAPKSRGSIVSSRVSAAALRVGGRKIRLGDRKAMRIDSAYRPL